MTDLATPVLEIKSLSGGYGRVPILHGIEFQVAAGELVGVLGHNGMGKTTLLKTLMGFLPSSAGQLRYCGSDITRLAPHQRAAMGIGYVPQGRGIFPQLSVRDNLRFAWHDYGQGSEEEGIEAVLQDFPRLRLLLDRDGGALSGGEQQLLALARCLMGDPDFLLLDEPTEGIQPSIIEEMAETILMLRQSRGLSVLLVEQNFDFIADLSDRVLVLERGRITGELSREDLKDQAKVDQFLGFGAARATRATPATGAAAASQVSGTLTTPPLPRSGEARGVVPPTILRTSPQVAPQPSPQPAGQTPPQTPLPPAPLHDLPKASAMTLARPNLQQMRDMADRFGMNLSDAELAEYSQIIEPYMQAYDRLHAAPDYLPEVRYPRSPGYQPDPSENPQNAWYVKTDVRGAPDGPLRGKRIALKDTICLAGVPMMNGSSIMEGYTPEIDATIVTRMLDAGATIAGKAHCENFCLSGGSHTNAKGPVHNPWKHGYMAGGSSSGSAVLVATGEVDMAIAGDQGGSIRIPASNCGVYGMKPTHGLVPYTGAMPIEQTIDHLGPVTRTVADNALLLEVLAGADGLDPRQYAPQTHRYTEALGRSVYGMRIGLLKEGFGHPVSEPDVDSKVMQAAERFRALGAQVEEVSVPEHFLAADAWLAITLEGLQDGMMWGNSTGTNYKGLFLPSMTDHMAQWQNRADELSHSLKACMFTGEHFQTRYRGRFYGKGQNLMRKAMQAYMAVLGQYDLLLMPTVPQKPQQIPPADCSITTYVQKAFEMVANTTPFNGGLPAMSVPCGLSEGLPVGMMLVGPFWGEMKIYQAAHAFETSGDWREM